MDPARIDLESEGALDFDEETTDLVAAPHLESDDENDPALVIESQESQERSSSSQEQTPFDEVVLSQQYLPFGARPTQPDPHRLAPPPPPPPPEFPQASPLDMALAQQQLPPATRLPPIGGPAAHHISALDQHLQQHFDETDFDFSQNSNSSATTAATTTTANHRAPAPAASTSRRMAHPAVAATHQYAVMSSPSHRALQQIKHGGSLPAPGPGMLLPGQLAPSPANRPIQPDMEQAAGSNTIMPPPPVPVPAPAPIASGPALPGMLVLAGIGQVTCQHSCEEDPEEDTFPEGWESWENVGGSPQVRNIDAADFGNALLCADYVNMIFCHLLRRETLNLAVSYVDRFLTSVPVIRSKLQLLGIGAVLVACKFEEITTPGLEEFVYICDNSYTKEEVRGVNLL
ncbi:hypothetical protein PAPYR_5906 [Paratrimastix pyriformis]|uniref:Cyclin-like domain-containing protein n=1 Tax=Paratrimastix pyriformis TaxID=342808 RepID=A0ABQ8UKX0_9EUKA|nr:hypothetical protein PAPYR_5906 [Paratrimastix pyriformis]